MFSNPKKLFFISLVVCLAVWTVTLVFFWRIYEKRENVIQLTREAASLSERKEEIKTLARELNLAEADIHELGNFVISGSQEGIVRFIELIELLSVSSGSAVNIDSVAVSPLEDSRLAKDYELLVLNLEIAGTWSQVFQFLNLAENLPYKTAINKVSFNELDVVPEEGRPLWRGGFSLEVVKFKQ